MYRTASAVTCRTLAIVRSLSLPGCVNIKLCIYNNEVTHSLAPRLGLQCSPNYSLMDYPVKDTKFELDKHRKIELHEIRN